MKWVKLMRQVSTTSLGDDARETLETGVVLRASVRQHLRSKVDSSATHHADGYQRCGVNACLLWPEWQ